MDAAIAKTKSNLQSFRGAAGRNARGKAGPKIDDEVGKLVTRSWDYLQSEDLWGSPVTTSQSPLGPITAWKHWLPKGVYGSENSIVRAKGLVRAPPQEIFDMIYDSGRTKEYNQYSVGRTDIEQVGKGGKTKVVWNRTAPPGTKRPHDFCTLMHGIIFPKNGTMLLMTTATQHPKAKPSSAYLRSEILLGVNHMRPVGPRLTELTTISHVKTTGVPAFLADKFAAGSACDFIKTVDSVLSKEGGDVPQVDRDFSPTGTSSNLNHQRRRRRRRCQ